MSVEPNILVSLDTFIIIGIWRELDFRNSWTSSLSIQYQAQCSQGLSKVALQILHVQWGTINKVVFQCNFWNVSTSLTVRSVTYNFEQNIFLNYHLDMPRNYCQHNLSHEILYAGHYKQWLVYFLTTFWRQFLCFWGCPYLWFCLRGDGNQDWVILEGIR